MVNVFLLNKNDIVFILKVFYSQKYISHLYQKNTTQVQYM